MREYDRSEKIKEKEYGNKMNKTVYIAGMPEGVKDNKSRIRDLENLLTENGYQTTGRTQIVGEPAEPKLYDMERFRANSWEEAKTYATAKYGHNIHIGVEEVGGYNYVAYFTDKRLAEKYRPTISEVAKGLIKEPANQLRTNQREPWQMTKEEFEKTAVPLPDRKDFIKAWLKDNEDIPNLVKPGINYIEKRNGSLLVFGNQRGQAVGIISFHKDAVEHIVVSDRYKGRGIATQLLEESRKYGVRRITGAVSPEAAGTVHRFMVRTAFLEGKPVPADVLREYPDLAMKSEKQRWRRTV